MDTAKTGSPQAVSLGTKSPLNGQLVLLHRENELLFGSASLKRMPPEAGAESPRD
jgi:hypothetical protein